MNNKIIILDGGMGRQLEAMGAPFRQPEWSALALIESPETVLEAHQTFINAGAQIITTNSYAVIPFHIGQERFDNKGRDLISLSAKLARQAANNCSSHKVKVAGCLPPAMGSYRPDLFDKKKAEKIYTPLIEEQIDNIDFWLAETISSIEEIKFISSLVKDTKKPLWASFTLTNKQDKANLPTLRSNENLLETFKIALDLNIDALLFNCSQPEEITDAIKLASHAALPIPYGAYANSFSNKNKENEANKILHELRNDITPEVYFNFAQEWVANGATIIGGCCGIGPEHIKKLASL